MIELFLTCNIYCCVYTVFSLFSVVRESAKITQKAFICLIFAHFLLISQHHFLRMKEAREQGPSMAHSRLHSQVFVWSQQLESRCLLQRLEQILQGAPLERKQGLWYPYCLSHLSLYLVYILFLPEVDCDECYILCIHNLDEYLKWKDHCEDLKILHVERHWVGSQQMPAMVYFICGIYDNYNFPLICQLDFFLNRSGLLWRSSRSSFTYLSVMWRREMITTLVSSEHELNY